MNINGSDDFAGSSMLAVRDTVRDLLQRLHGLFDQEDFLYYYKGVEGGEKAVLRKLINEDYIRLASKEERNRSGCNYEDADNVWVLTVRGGALANASAAKPIRRATARNTLTSFLDRIEEVSSDSRCLWVVDEAVLFGSMLDPTRDPVSDVDVAVRLVQHQERCEAAGERALDILFEREMGWRHIPVNEVEFFGRNDVLKKLKSRKSSLSLHLINEKGEVGGLADISYDVIYQRGTGRLPVKY